METLYLFIIGVLILLVFISLYRYIRLININTQPQKKPEDTTLRQQNDFKQELADDISNFPAWEKKHPPADPVLPTIYHRDILVLMVRDANWLYAYWEITGEKLQQHPAQHNNQFVLRLYDITAVDNFDGTNANWHQDIIIPGPVDNWHIEVQAPERSYCVDLGYMLEGRFITLLRSNRVCTPSVTVSDVLDEDWLPIDALYNTTSRFDESSGSLLKEPTCSK